MSVPPGPPGTRGPTRLGLGPRRDRARRGARRAGAALRSLALARHGRHRLRRRWLAAGARRRASERGARAPARAGAGARARAAAAREIASDALTMLDELRRELEVPTARLRVDIGPASEQLTTASRGAALVVVGGADGQADRMKFGGSVRASLARNARCPVVVVPAVPRLGGREVICGVRDWADVATATVARRLAGALGLPLLLMHILPPAAGRDEARRDHAGRARASLGPRDRVSAARARRGRCRRHAVPAWSNRGPPVAGWRTRRRLASAGLLVVGAPTRGRLGAALTGSASAHLMRRSQRPLVICCGASVPGLPQAF